MEFSAVTERPAQAKKIKTIMQLDSFEENLQAKMTNDTSTIGVQISSTSEVSMVATGGKNHIDYGILTSIKSVQNALVYYIYATDPSQLICGLLNFSHYLLSRSRNI